MQGTSYLGISALSVMIMCRMLGLFMVAPLFSVYASQLKGATPFLIGLALGIYGLTQGIFQIPFSMWSDRIGRKKIIVFGLVLFALGSIIAALSESIVGVVLGRAVQGMGAISSTVLALAADLTLDEDRGTAMAILGLSYGISFGLSMILGPILHQWLTLQGMFWMTLMLSLLALVVLYTAVPKPTQWTAHPTMTYQKKQVPAVFKNPILWKLNISIFVLHTSLTATFMGLPLVFGHTMHWNTSQIMHLYLYTALPGFLLAWPFIRYAEKKQRSAYIIRVCIVLIFLNACFLAGSAFVNPVVIVLGFVLFFMSLTFLESILPSVLSKIAPIAHKGTAMGLYSTLQFLGIFCGGLLSGFVLSHGQAIYLFCVNAGLCVFWWFFMRTFQEPPQLKTLSIKPKNASLDVACTELMRFPGIAEVAWVAEEQVLYVKVEMKHHKTVQDALTRLVGIQ